MIKALLLRLCCVVMGGHLADAVPVSEVLTGRVEEKPRSVLATENVPISYLSERAQVRSLVGNILESFFLGFFEVRIEKEILIGSDAVPACRSERLSGRIISCEIFDSPLHNH